MSEQDTQMESQICTYSCTQCGRERLVEFELGEYPTKPKGWAPVWEEVTGERGFTYEVRWMCPVCRKKEHDIEMRVLTNSIRKEKPPTELPAQESLL